MFRASELEFYLYKQEARPRGARAGLPGPLLRRDDPPYSSLPHSSATTMMDEKHFLGPIPERDCGGAGEGSPCREFSEGRGACTAARAENMAVRGTRGVTFPGQAHDLQGNGGGHQRIAFLKRRLGDVTWQAVRRRDTAVLCQQSFGSLVKSHRMARGEGRHFVTGARGGTGTRSGQYLGAGKNCMRKPGPRSSRC